MPAVPALPAWLCIGVPACLPCTIDECWTCFTVGLHCRESNERVDFESTWIVFTPQLNFFLTPHLFP